MLLKLFGYTETQRALVCTNSDVSDGGACLLLVSGKALLHRDKIGRGINIGFGVNAVGSILVTGVVGGGAKESEKKNMSKRKQNNKTGLSRLFQ